LIRVILKDVIWVGWNIEAVNCNDNFISQEVNREGFHDFEKEWKLYLTHFVKILTFACLHILCVVIKFTMKVLVLC